MEMYEDPVQFNDMHEYLVQYPKEIQELYNDPVQQKETMEMQDDSVCTGRIKRLMKGQREA